MLNIIALIVYMSFINMVYVNKLSPSLKNKAGDVALPMNNSSNIKRRKNKYCNFKCDCFFSHSVKNDNICVPIWIKPLGL